TSWLLTKSLRVSFGPGTNVSLISNSLLALSRQLLDPAQHLADLERLPLDLVQLLAPDPEPPVEHERKLPQVQLRDEDALVAAQEARQVPRERVQVTDVRVRDGEALALRRGDRGADRAVSAAPADDEQVALRRSEYLLLGNRIL